MRLYYQRPLLPWRKERTTFAIEQGLRGNPRVELVQHPDDADCILLPCTFFGRKMLTYPNPFPPEKTLFVDWWDLPDDVHRLDCRLYFKRSWARCREYPEHVERFPGEWPGHFRPTTFSVLDEYLVEPDSQPVSDLGCFFREAGLRNRANVLRVCERVRGGRKRLGIVGACGVDGRADFNQDFYRAMRSCRIVVTCQPDCWDGDYRTWEAFASGALVFVDRMSTPLPHPLVDGEHCIFYDVDPAGLELMREKVEYYVAHPEKAAEIADRGFEHVMRYHRPRNRLDAMLDEWEES